MQYDFHEGLDLQATSPESVYAAHSGTAHLVPQSRDEGNWIWIENGSTRTYYMHLSEFNNSIDDQWVNEHDYIGMSGDSGCPGSPHLHFEYRYNNDAKHPLQVMSCL